MKFEYLGNSTILKQTKNFDLDQTFDCGQCFRFEKINNIFEGISKNYSVKLVQNNDEVTFLNINQDDFKNYWYNYFDLSTDYALIGKKLSLLHPILKEAYTNCSGIRILKQEPWETLCSFIISQNNNIPRIKKIISSLCCLYGEKTTNGFLFPKVEKISSLNVSQLEPIRSGFRAKYILDAAQKVAGGEIDFNQIEKLDYLESKNLLMKIHGVGPKVADCVLLYGFHKLEAFPMDVWMKKIMNKFFKDKSPDFFGEFAGVAQQYLYHYTRSNPQILD